MVIIRNMRVDEYPAYCQYFIDDYSKEIAENYGHSIDVAIDLAKQDLNRHFPNGLESEGHDLLCIESEINSCLIVVGYLWHAKNSSDNSTFIYDFYISNEYRGNGFGKQAINEFEVHLQAIGITQIKLRVAYHNNRAFKLYHDVGFIVTGYNMSKKISMASS
ncbi:MAG: GNAT family N-acetyltransferase [Psychromonas sp.]